MRGPKTHERFTRNLECKPDSRERHNSPRIARHRGMKKAIVALARRLAVIMHRMWVDGTEFRWTRDVVAA